MQLKVDMAVGSFATAGYVIAISKKAINKPEKQNSFLLQDIFI